MHSKKIIRSLKKKFIESTGVLFSILLVLTAITFAATTWTPGSAPLAAPGDGNVAIDNFWTKNGPAKIFYNSGNVGIGTSDPNATLEVNGNIIATDPTDDNHMATKSYVDASGGGGGGSVYTLWGTTSCHDNDTKIQSGRGYFAKYSYGWDQRGYGGLAGPFCSPSVVDGSWSYNGIDFQNHANGDYVNCVVCKTN